jgi:hypothetical protein
MDWLEKEQRAGYLEVAEDVHNEWEQTQLCPRVCEKLGSAEPAIISITHL